MPKTIRTALLLLALPNPLTGQSYLPPLSEVQMDSVRVVLAGMKIDERGPYLRIRWFCRDGTVQPPQGTPCAERDGGNQHAEMKPEAGWLAARGFHVGTILQRTPFEEFVDAAWSNDRLKQLLLEDYLIGVDDGWVLRRARFYRGARQAEDEERSGSDLLQRLLADTAWVSRQYWLANQLVATVPHIGIGGDQMVQRIRNLATEAANLEPAFLPTRVRIHSFPSAADVQAVSRFLQRPGLSEPARAKLTDLRVNLISYYDPGTQLANLGSLEKTLSKDAILVGKLRAMREAMAAGRTDPAVRAAADLSAAIRARVIGSTDGRNNLRLLDLNAALQDQAVRLAAQLFDETRQAPRRTRIESLPVYFGLAHGAGLLSGRERAALVEEAASLAALEQVPALEYWSHVNYLARSLEWSVRTIRSTMSPALERYQAVEPLAAGYPDGVTRGSILLPLSGILTALSTDVDEVLGASHDIFGSPVRTGIRGLNPGIAAGPLLFASLEEIQHLDRGSIYVLPETVSELRPVAGVLTLDAGNLLSHVQLLARNLGIPNAAVATSVLPGLAVGAGRDVLFVVTPLGRVILQDTASLDDQMQSLLTSPNTTDRSRVRLDDARLRLDVVLPVPLGDLRSDASGVIVGPKAANLGQLAFVFPDRVAPGVALPFGMFRRHVDRKWNGERTPLERLSAAYGEAAAMRSAGATEDDVDAFMFGCLAEMRGAIEELEWLPDVRGAIVDAIGVTFGSDLSAGIFVRSDTNVEDLPQFSGAGLNLTVPNQRSIADILAAIKRVWTSPFSDRAYLWRKQILDDQSAVYPSVLLLRTVASEKSGVLISAGLQLGSPADLTIAAAEGVGGAVDGEDAETIIVSRDGTIRLISQAKSPRRRVLGVGGGAEMVPARRPEVLITGDEISQLLDIVGTWKDRTTDLTAGRIWDMEFGVVDGHVWLFQVRPFIRFRSSQILEKLSVLDEEVMQNADVPVRLDDSR